MPGGFCWVFLAITGVAAAGVALIVVAALILSGRQD
jgi:hypothetical protein